MIEVRQTVQFRDWHGGLRDRRAAGKITARLARLELGNFGDVKPVGEGVSELRVHEGAGYRVYIVKRGEALVVVLCGGDKSTQEKDIDRAKMLAAEVET